ncbi:hypothetical protein V6Z79_008216 [Aspergillus fumigatus]
MKLSLLLLLSAVYTATGTAATTTTATAATHVIYSYPGVSPPASLLSLIAAGKVGGLILFGENIDDNLPATIATIQKTYASSPDYNGTPLLIMTDQEGGKVRRLPGGPTLSAKQVGLSSDPAATAGETGTEAATTLAQYGVNANLAPVLGVYRSAGDFLDEYGRSYGNSSELVASCAEAFIRNQQARKVIATAKHFPGLGAAGADANTDLVPVQIDLGLEELRRVDEAPYRAAIAAGVEMVMASWAVYPALDAKPAGLSEKWIRGELRQRHGFQGVTITDAIEAGALRAYGDDAARGVRAAQAGMDLLLASARNVTQGEAIVDALTAALEHGELDTEEFAAATARIMALRRTLHSAIFRGPPSTPNSTTVSTLTFVAHGGSNIHAVPFSASRRPGPASCHIPHSRSTIAWCRKNAGSCTDENTSPIVGPSATWTAACAPNRPRGARVQHREKLLDRLRRQDPLHGGGAGEPVQRTNVKAALETARVVSKGRRIERAVQLVQVVDVQRAHWRREDGTYATKSSKRSCTPGYCSFGRTAGRDRRQNSASM